jgi:hypothetical protein
MAGLADISLFESLQSSPNSSISVFNSDIAPLITEYDKYKQWSQKAIDFIGQAQTSQPVPTDILTFLYAQHENYNDQLVKLIQQIASLAQKSAPDAFDRGILKQASDAAKQDLTPYLTVKAQPVVVPKTPMLPPAPVPQQQPLPKPVAASQQSSALPVSKTTETDQVL